MSIESLSTQPIKLLQNRVRRPFFGGSLLDEWQGVTKPTDGYAPEEWVASLVEARNPDPLEKEGLSKAILSDGRIISLKEMIEASPELFLGKAHVAKYASSLAILVKVLDSYTRLLIQVHPDKCKAMELFNSQFGKTEAWYVLGGREVDGEKPYVLLGFKPGITREIWVDLFNKENTEGMIDALHKFYVKPGDVFLVQGGVPHAAGSGLFFIEIQEPTDYTIRTERKNLAGEMLSDMQLHQGLGFDKMFDCFDYKGFNEEEVLEKFRLKPCLKDSQEGGVEEWLISPCDTSYFSMSRLVVERDCFKREEKGFSIAVIVSGNGKLICNNIEIEINSGDEFFMPAGLKSTLWVNLSNKPLEVVNFYPPKVGN